MNLVLLPEQTDSTIWQINDARQVSHLKQHLDVKIGDQIKVGVLNQARYLAEVVEIQSNQMIVTPVEQQAIPNKLPVTLILALPRPKVLRRLIMDSVTLGVEKIVLLHSYRVDKSYWQTPFLEQLDHYIQLGLEQAGDVIAPSILLEKRFKPFVEDRLSVWNHSQTTFVAHPYTTDVMPINFNQQCQLMIGPEGGFIPYEIDLLKENGCHIHHVGNRILRTETAVSNILGRLFCA
ncbi:16S rRNA (uracil(1498)-N(3))-methyltransferase [Acinetobacter sp. A3.8]|uniref:Ribosomal RNA small subunit methyltransferase E n=1 Tax=Acinetobacter sedimenti TaxID=2919922 RepID=A0A9X2B795_9GAMM|nr:16S rRNA (uracil(1498)-N(3))-methyltransferase [Acinetobacter sedimenti]MCJ8146872.1 16S rRNA (uracil(1498)-N(3))-methyltransferase [Acinetobacter sedimenti]